MFNYKYTTSLPAGKLETTSFEIIPFSKNYGFFPQHPEYRPLHALQGLNFLNYRRAYQDTYAEAAYHFFNPMQGGKIFCFQNLKYLIFPGSIFQVVSGFSSESNLISSFTEGIVIRPLVLSYVMEEEVNYVVACCKTWGRAPDQDSIHVCIDEHIDMPKTPWKGLRFLYKKFLKDDLKNNSLSFYSDLDSFVSKPQIPIFNSIEEREKTLQRTALDIFNNV